MADPSLLGLAGLGFDCHGSLEIGKKPFVGAAALYRVASYGKSSQECSTVCAWVCTRLCTCHVWVPGYVSGRTREGDVSSILHGHCRHSRMGLSSYPLARGLVHLSYHFLKKGSKRSRPLWRTETRVRSGCREERTLSVGSIRMILICLVSLRDPGNCNEIGTKFLCVPKLWFRTTCSGFQNSLSKQAQEPEEIKTEG